MQSALMLTFAEPAKAFGGFVGTFLAIGAVGFRYSALRGRLVAADHDFFFDAAKNAALIGSFGLLITIIMTVTGLPASAAKAHSDVMTFIASDLMTGIRLAMLALAIVGFGLAVARVQAGWLLVAIALSVANFRSLFAGQFNRLVQPVHLVAASLWLGTLFILVTAGLSALLRHEPTRDRRGAIARDMVNSFSPLALTMGMIVVLMGVILSWQHLTAVSDLWQTTYGIVLLVKLAFVAMVFGLGAWNWRRQRPQLGTEEGANAIRRSSRAELTIAVIVLIITAILGAVPGPKG